MVTYVILWLTDRETLVLLMATALQQCVILKQDLKKIAEEIVADIDKDTVDFQLNFDDSLQEPVVMPARIPNLLINGASGIAVGMATNMPPHNIG